MKICFVNMPVEYYSPVAGGAISTIIAELAAALEATGHRVHVLTYTDRHMVHTAGRVIDLGPMPRPRKPRRALDRLSRKVQRRPYPAYPQYLRRVRSALREVRPTPDVVVVFNDFAATPVLRRALPEAKVVVWLQNELPQHRQTDLAAPDAVVATSDYIRDHAIAGGVAAAKAHTILNGVNLDVFQPDGREPHEVPRVLLVGRLDPNKGFHVALAALAEARDAGCHFDTTLAGARWWYGAEEPSPYEQELFASLEAIGGTYAGLVPRNRIAALFREHDLTYVLSLSQEPFGLVVLEAMASGCAVIASPRGGIPQASGGAALLVDPDDQAAVTAATIKVLNDPAELARLQHEGLAHAAGASWRVRAESFVQLVRSLETS
jgi:glycosyltransferase involved in cell wall biosynthesis